MPRQFFFLQFELGQTVESFLEQFKNFPNKAVVIPWECIGGLFENLTPESDGSGRKILRVPVVVKEWE